MLTPPSRRDEDLDDFTSSGIQSTVNIYEELERILAAVRRQLWIVAAAVIISLGLGVFSLLSTTPLFTASTLVLIDNRRVRAVENSYDATQTPDLAASVVDSQVEVVKSAQVAEAVIQKLNLLDLPEYTRRPPPGIFQKVRDQFSNLLQSSELPLPVSKDDREGKMQRAIERVQFSLDVRRVGRTMVLQISYSATSPEKAAEFANAYSEAYLTDQLNSKYEATRRASEWLEERLGELKKKAINADLAVQKFKADHSLITSGGKLVNEQQLSEINTQLVNARAERARSEARYRRIEEIIRSRETSALVSEAIGNQIIEQLRAKYLEVSKRKAELTARVGEEHQSVIGLRAEMDEYERQMFAELSRLAEAYKSEVDINKAKESSLAENLLKLVETAAGENKSLVGLRELEREGEAYRNLYQSYMQRYQESLQQQSFPIVEARIITPAAPPLKPSSPKKLLTLVMFAFFGGAIGAAIGALREFREKGFRRAEQVRSELGIECLGLLPFVKEGKLVEPPARSWRWGLKKAARGMRMATPKPHLSGAKAVGGKASFARSSSVLPDGGEIETSSPIMSYVLDHPISAFAEVLLAGKLCADIKLSGSTSKIIGIISALPSEGKSVIAKNFGDLLATLNAATLLIDADLRGPGLTSKLKPTAEEGLIDAVIGAKPWDQSLFKATRSGLYFLPSGNGAQVAYTSELLASQGMRNFLAEAEQQFEYIILDLPPFGPIVDVKALAPQIQAFIYVTEWRHTSRRVARDILLHSNIRPKCLGVILNKVDVNKITLFEEHGSRYYYYQRYKKAYYLDS